MTVRLNLNRRPVMEASYSLSWRRQEGKVYVEVYSMVRQSFFIHSVIHYTLNITVFILDLSGF